MLQCFTVMALPISTFHAYKVCFIASSPNAAFELAP